MDEGTYPITLLDYLLHWATIFVIGGLLFFGAKIEGNKARWDHYVIRKKLRRMFRKMKIQDLEKDWI